MKSKFLLPVVVLLVLLGLLVFLLRWEPASEQAGKEPVADFTLQAEQGAVDFTQFRGKLLLLYFGYTYCPDVCPTSLAMLGFALGELSEKELAEIQPVFVSVDPARDTVERLAEYTGYFHPSLLGVTGTDEEIARVAAQYQVSYRIEEVEGSDEYVVDHSSLLYLLDRNGKLHETLLHGTPPEEMIASIRQLLVK